MPDIFAPLTRYLVHVLLFYSNYSTILHKQISSDPFFIQIHQAFYNVQSRRNCSLQNSRDKIFKTAIVHYLSMHNKVDPFNWFS